MFRHLKFKSILTANSDVVRSGLNSVSTRLLQHTVKCGVFYFYLGPASAFASAHSVLTEKLKRFYISCYYTALQSAAISSDHAPCGRLESFNTISYQTRYCRSLMQNQTRAAQKGVHAGGWSQMILHNHSTEPGGHARCFSIMQIFFFNVYACIECWLL